MSSDACTAIFLSLTPQVTYKYQSGCKYVWLTCSEFLSCHITTWVLLGVAALGCTESGSASSAHCVGVLIAGLGEVKRRTQVREQEG